MESHDGVKGLLELFNCSTKRDVKKHCRQLLATSTNLADLIIAGMSDILSPYLYANHFMDRIPDHLEPTQEESEALARNGVGPLVGPAKRFVRKTFQLFTERRCFAAHLFYSPDGRYWHLFYFDQRDTTGAHWKHGPHIHYASDLFTRLSLQEVWERVRIGDITFLKAEHLRYLQTDRTRRPDAPTAQTGGRYAR